MQILVLRAYKQSFMLRTWIARVMSAMLIVAFVVAFLLGQGGNENLMHTSNCKLYSLNTDGTEH